MGKKDNDKEKSSNGGKKKEEFVFLDLPCAMSKDQVVTKTSEMIKAMDEGTRVGAEAKSIAEGYREQLAGINSTITRLRTDLREQIETRSIRCVELFYKEKSEVVTIRLDTGDLVSSRPADKQKTIYEEIDEKEEPQTQILIPTDGETKDGKKEPEKVMPPSEIHPPQKASLMRRLRLRDRLKLIDVNLKLSGLYWLTDDDLGAAEVYIGDVLRAKSMGEEPIIPRPKWIDDALGKTIQQVESEERAQFIQKLLDAIGTQIGIPTIVEWTEEQRHEVTDWATSAYAVRVLKSPGAVEKEMPELLKVEPAKTDETVAGGTEQPSDDEKPSIEGTESSIASPDETATPTEETANPENATDADSESVPRGTSDADQPAPAEVEKVGLTYTRPQFIDQLMPNLMELNVPIKRDVVETWTEEQLIAAQSWSSIVILKSKGTLSDQEKTPRRPKHVPAPVDAHTDDETGKRKPGRPRKET